MVKTITVTQQEGYALYPDKRGINTIFLPYKTQRFDRGGPYYPNNLEEVKNDGIELPFSTYCSNLASADCNLLRVKWNGRCASEADGWHSLEPPPAGTYNIWQTALDPDTLATYRSQQVTYPVGGAAWAASNLKVFINQCVLNGVYLHVILFEASEFLDSGWPYSAYNASNRYTNGVNCEIVDQGFLTNPYDFFDDATAIQAAKDRIDFVVDVMGTSRAVVSWELFAEMTWCLVPDFWDEASWAPNMTNNIRNKVNPWVTTMGNYLRAADTYNRPISIGLLRPPVSGVWPADPNHQTNVQNEPMVQFPVDIACMNMYEGDWDNALEKMKLAHEYTYKLIWVTQFSPIQFDDAPAEEPSPYLESKKHLWVGTCGERWGLAPIRWPGLREQSDNNWAEGGYADVNLYSIPGITKTFNQAVSWNTWATDHEVFDSYISSGGTRNISTGTGAMIAYGDNENVTMLLEWSAGGSKTVDVSNLANGAYTFTYYDWTDGSIAGTLTPTAAGGSLSMTFDVTPFQDNMVVAHLLKD